MIFLSAGHYPSRPGAGFEGFFEHDEAMLWADAFMHPFVVFPALYLPVSCEKK